jgi:release factor glutamine methyltransferase
VPFLTQKGIANARFDIECLMAFVLGINRLKVYLQYDRPLDKEELTKIRELIKRRINREPLQYILGKREFFGYPFKVTPGVLIPRPETELLVEKALEWLKTIPEDKRTLLDLGTGSGCIVLSIVNSLPCHAWAVDLSEKALEIAKENEISLNAKRPIQWRLGSWFEALQGGDPKQYQVIVTNPPYIAIKEKGELEPEVALFEPSEALYAGETGLDAFEKLAPDLVKYLAPGGVAFLEIHQDRAEKIELLFKNRGVEVSISPDLRGLPRILVLKK